MQFQRNPHSSQADGAVRRAMRSRTEPAAQDQGCVHDFARHHRPPDSGTQCRPSAEVRAKAQELTKGMNGDLEKTEALYDFVAKNFRYVSLSLGVGRYQPHVASEVDNE